MSLSTNTEAANKQMSQTEERPNELPDNIADAWAAVLIDIHEKRGAAEDQEQGTDECPHEKSSVSPT